jgi:[ribosomal protein S5]-alanine N-acetyltransferase
MTTLTSTRLVLQPHTLASLEPLHRWENDEEILQLSSDSLERSDLSQIRSTLERWMQPQTDILHFAIHLKDDGTLIGFLHVAQIDHDHQRCKLGLLIGEKRLWERGYGTEALKLAVEHCFTALCMNRIAAEVYATNPRSVRMLERVGFVREGVLRQNVKRDRFVDEYQYGLLRSEWEQTRRA